MHDCSQSVCALIIHTLFFFKTDFDDEQNSSFILTAT